MIAGAGIVMGKPRKTVNHDNSATQEGTFSAVGSERLVVGVAGIS